MVRHLPLPIPPTFENENHTLCFAAMGHHDASRTQFQYLNSIATGLQHLRSITLGGPDSRYLIAGGVHGGGAKIFERTGTSLQEVAKVDIEKPACFVWL